MRHDPSGTAMRTCDTTRREHSLEFATYIFRAFLRFFRNNFMNKIQGKMAAIASKRKKLQAVPEGSWRMAYAAPKRGGVID